MSSANRTRRRGLHTIGARLTLWGALVTFATSAALCTALYAGVFLTLRQEIDTFLDGEVREFLSTANTHEGDDRSLEREFSRELGARMLGDLAFRLYDANGRLLITSERDDAVARGWQPDRSPPNRYRTLVFETVSTSEPGRAFRICTLRTTLNDGRTCFAQASYTLERMNQALAQFRKVCLVALVLSVVIAFAVGRFLATRSLKPIRVIAARARRIGADQLARRLPVSGSGDELDQLIVTLNDLLARIERYVSQLRQFTADASHELRTPLAALRGSTEVALSRERSAGGLRRVLEEHITHFERMQRIAEDLLLLSRLDAGESVLKNENVALPEAILATVDLYRPVAEERAIQLSVSPMPPVEVVGDSGRIRQVLCNLLDNAVKFTGEAGHISLSLAEVDGNARISIRDDGMGITEVDLPRVFDRFYCADRARAIANGAGSGLGLSICRSIVRAHGGDIHLRSQVGVGTTVAVDLPILAAGEMGPLRTA